MGRVRDTFRALRFRLRRDRAGAKGPEDAGAPLLPYTARSLEQFLAPELDPLCPQSRHGGRIERGVPVLRDVDVRAGDVLGAGCSGSVVAGFRRVTGQRVAIKAFAKSKLKDRQLARLDEEVNVYLQVDHPNICRLLNVYEKGDKLWLVMELCRCELYHRLKELHTFSETRARDSASQMLKAVGYLHSHNIVHRDLKLENWMYSSADGPERLKLIDFGFAQRLSSESEELSVPCGTLLYVSPELLRQKYTIKTDMWSLGVLCYMMLEGRAPFKGANDTKTAHLIQRGELLQDARWRALSPGARDLVCSLLRKDAGARLSARAALQHPWLAEGGQEAAASPTASLGAASQASEPLWRFGHGSRLQRAALRRLACGLTSRDLEAFEQAFLALDTAGRGSIARAELQAVVKSHCPDVSAAELDQILESLDVDGAQEVPYSGFVAAMLAASLDEHQSKVREAFDAFDVGGTGFLTAESLRAAFVGAGAGASPRLPTKLSPLLTAPPALSQREAEAWIAEVDYRGSGAIDFEGFVAALQGRRRSTAVLQDDDRPAVKVFCGLDAHRAHSLPMLSSASTREPSDELSGPSSDDSELRLRLQPAAASWTPVREPSLRVREIPLEVDASYFAAHD